MNYGYYQPIGLQPSGLQPQGFNQQIPQQQYGFPQPTGVQMDRLAELQYNAQLRDAQSQMIANQNTTKIISVGSIDEAKGFISPNDGSKVFFVNNNANEIYSKQLDFSNGKSIFNVYRLINIPEAVQAPQAPNNSQGYDYITREEYEALKGEYEALKAEIQKIKSEVNKNEIKSNSSNSIDKVGEKSQ